jgi:hypothetical protein
MSTRDGATSLGLGMILAVALGGCGGTNDVQKIKETVTRQLTAIADGDGKTACSLATESGRQQLQGGSGASCEQVVAFLSRMMAGSLKEGLRTVRIKRVTINGDNATIQDADITSRRGNLVGFTQAGASTQTTLVKQADGSWKVSD